MATLFSYPAEKQVQMSLVAVGILHVVATKKGGINPAFYGL